MMKRILLGLAVAGSLVLTAQAAMAACSTTIAIKDGTGTSQTTCATTDGGSNLVPSVGILGGTNNANKATVDSNGGLGINLLDVAGSAVAQGHGTAATAIRVELPTDGTGIVGANQNGTWTVQPGNTPNTSAWLVQPVPGTTNGATLFTLNSAASTNSTNVKSSAGTLYHIDAQTTATAVRYLLAFNASSAPTCTGTPVATWTIPAVSSTGNAGGGFVVDFSVGAAFSTGIGFCITTAIGGTGSAAANDTTVNITYK